MRFIKASSKHDKVKLSQPCEKTFEQFKLLYNKVYSPEQEAEAKMNYCQNVKNILALRAQNPSLEIGLNSYADLQSMRRHTTQPTLKAPALPIATQQSPAIPHKQTATVHNYNRQTDYSHCASPYSGSSSNVIPTSRLAALLPAQAPLSVDLREWGLMQLGTDQGTCGSCWAFTTRAIATSLLVHDLPYYRQVYPNNSRIQAMKNSNARLSVQQILNNSWGQNKMCGGGNFFVAAVEIANGFTGSMDFDDQIPYMSAMWASSQPASAPIHVEPKTADFQQTPLNPIHLFANGQNCPQVFFELDLGNPADHPEIKKFLGLGHPMGASMVAGNADAAFQFYKNGIASGQCATPGHSDHQVTLVGYGHYKAEPVWLFLNSWGVEWGQQGYFMVKQGSNSFCIEQPVQGVFSRFTGFDAADDQKLFNETQLYKGNPDIFVSQFAQMVKRGVNGMDNYEAGTPVFTTHEFGWPIWVIVAVLGVFGALWIWAVIKCIFCPGRKAVKATVYLKFQQEEAHRVEWPEPEVEEH